MGLECAQGHQHTDVRGRVAVALWLWYLAQPNFVCGILSISINPGIEVSANMESCPKKMGVCPALTLQFRELSYSVPHKKGKLKEVLHDISGQILSGRLTAILGPSGAGKTSLLNVLAGFKTNGVSGSVLVNGRKRCLAEFRTQSCYIFQDLSMLGVLTAQETLIIAAKLKLASYTDEMGSCVVSDVLELLNLTDSRHTQVQNMSGGEQKRLFIALELITNPPIMFLDEPTSGLDSVSSAQVINHLRSLALAGRTVVCVVHQPNSQMCHLFDDVILLATGQILYSGPINQMVPVFEEAGFAYPKDYNRADFALEIACLQRGQDLSNLLERFHSSAEFQDYQDCVDTCDTVETKMLPQDSTGIFMDTKHNGRLGINNCSNSNMTSTNENTTRYAVSQMRQFQILLGRNFLVGSRERYMTYARLLSHAIIGVLVGLMCYDIGNEASKMNTNTANLSFFIMVAYYINSMITVLTFPMERAMLLRELHNNWYSMPAYFFSKCISNLPLQLICPTLFVVIAYFMTGQPCDATRVLMTLLVCVLLCIIGQTMGMVSGGAFGAMMGLLMISVTTFPLLLFSGFFVRLPDIPFFLRWLAEVSLFKQSFEVIMCAVYGLDRKKLHCSEDFCFFKNPTKFLEDMGMHEDNLWYDICGLVIWVLITHVLFYLVVKWRVHISK